MHIIKEIHIKYFRSLYDVVIDVQKNQTVVLTGKNDTGKSNVLRALNLFFHNMTDENEKFNFEKDFSLLRKQEIQHSSHKKQQVEIAVTFFRPSSYRSLPKTFTVKKVWSLNNASPDFSFSKDISPNLIYRFLNSIEYTYIPAIKDRETFTMIMSKLKKNLPNFGHALNFSTFNQQLASYGESLREDLHTHVGLIPALALPNTMTDLFNSLEFTITDSMGICTPLNYRGDGIRCRFIPAILNYISANSKKKHIWGLEEPENSLEFNKTLELNETLCDNYSENAQIFISSHSPAFVGTSKSHKCVILLTRKNGKVQSDVANIDLFHQEKIGTELGYLQLQQDLAKCLVDAQEKARKMQAAYDKLVTAVNKNIVFVEGESDVIYLQTAWKLFKPNLDQNFRLVSVGGASTIQAVLNNSECCSKTPGHIWLGLFDFDSSFNQWNSLKWSEFITEEEKGLCKKAANCEKYAMLLPVPLNRTSYAKKQFKGSSKLEIELLFPDEKLSNYLVAENAPGQMKVFMNSKKMEFAKLAQNFTKQDYVNFIPIIEQLENIFYAKK